MQDPARLIAKCGHASARIGVKMEAVGIERGARAVTIPLGTVRGNRLEAGIAVS